MAEIDDLSSTLFEEAKRFLERAKEGSDVAGCSANCHAALLLGFSGLEAHLNAIAEELSARPGLDMLDKSILLERDVALDGGDFVLLDKLKMFRVEDRIAYIFSKFAKGGFPNKEPWWSDLKSGLDARNRLVHPKAAVVVDAKATSRFLTAILECLNALYKGVFKRQHPAYKRGLDSKLHF